MDVNTILSGIGTLGGLAGAATFASALLNRTKIRAEAMATITDAAVREINELQEAASAARREAREARSEAAEARAEVAKGRQETAEARAEASEMRREMERVRSAAERLVTRLNEVTEAIHQSDMTLDRLRRIVPASSPNGSPSH